MIRIVISYPTAQPPLCSLSLSRSPHLRCNGNPSKRSEKLLELLKLPETSEMGVDEAEVETLKIRRKVEVFDELQEVGKRLQFEEGSLQKEAAVDVRRLAKEDSEARSTLAMLGAIPPLVGMLDSIDHDFQIRLTLCSSQSRNRK